ncbi:MAG: hypothetical protein ACOY3P_19485 [Planctomycetota bacterium]
MSVDIDALKDHFDVQQHGRNYHIYCKACRHGWSLPRDRISIGSALKLLDHAYSHDEEDEE